MNKAFINYRWNDTRPFAVKLHRELRKILGSKRVFLDSSSIQAGEVLPTKLQKEIKHAGALISLIGSEWETIRMNRVRRLHQKSDWVRQELEVARKRGILLIPVLVGRNTRPKASALPKSLRPLLSNIAVCAEDFTLPALARLLARRVRSDGLRLRIKTKSKYVGGNRGDISKDWFEWSARIDGPTRDLTRISQVTYYTYGSAWMTGDRQRRFAIEHEGHSDFEIRCTIDFDDGQYVTLYHDLILK